MLRSSAFLSCRSQLGFSFQTSESESESESLESNSDDEVGVDASVDTITQTNDVDKTTKTSSGLIAYFAYLNSMNITNPPVVVSQ